MKIVFYTFSLGTVITVVPVKKRGYVYMNFLFAAEI